MPGPFSDRSVLGVDVSLTWIRFRWVRIAKRKGTPTELSVAAAATIIAHRDCAHRCVLMGFIQRAIISFCASRWVWVLVHALIALMTVHCTCIPTAFVLLTCIALDRLRTKLRSYVVVVRATSFFRPNGDDVRDVSRWLATLHTRVRVAVLRA